MVIKVKTAFQRIIVPEDTDRDIGDQDVEEGWDDEVGRDFDGIKDVVSFLKDEGVTEPSSSCPHKGVWYLTEGSMDTHGVAESKHFFIDGATPREEQEIFRRLFPKEFDRCLAMEGRLKKRLELRE